MFTGGWLGIALPLRLQAAVSIRQKDDSYTQKKIGRLPDDIYSAGVEYVFPRDWNEDKMPKGIRLSQDGGWAVEKLSDDREIRWKFVFFKETIETLSDEQFQSLGEAVLQAWEQGRLRALIDALATRGCKKGRAD